MPAVYVEKLLDAVAVAGNGGPKPTGDIDEAVIQVVGIVAGDIVKIQGSNDEPKDVAPGDINWTDIEFDGSADLTANKLYVLTSTPNLLRAVYADDTGGGPVTVTLKGVR